MRLVRLPRLIWIAAGAAGAYLLDPENGAKRRSNLTSQITKRRQSLGSSGGLTGTSTSSTERFTPS